MKGVLCVGCSGFPHGMAQIQRQLNICRALKLAQVNVTVCSRKGVHQKSEANNGLSANGNYEGIDYVYASGTPFASKTFFVRNVLKVLGFLGELRLIVIKRIVGEADTLYVNTISLTDLAFYYMISRLFKMTLVYDYVEHVSSLATSSNWNSRFDNLLPNLCDKIVCISDVLTTTVLERKKEIPTLKIPALTDFDEIEAIKGPIMGAAPYLLYCGSAGYYEVIQYIINAFELAQTGNAELLLIVHGSQQNLKIVLDNVATSSKSQKIKIMSGLPYVELIAKYKEADALLIPLRDNLLDKARFPHKISEYTASETPLITNWVGEVKNYFTNGENAFIAKDNSVLAYAERITFVLNNQVEAEKVGKKGKELGKKVFDYKAYSEDLNTFISSGRGKR